MFISADGYEIRSGDMIYIRHRNSIKKTKVFNIISDYKLIYDTPDQEGFVSAKNHEVYKNKPKHCYEVD